MALLTLKIFWPTCGWFPHGRSTYTQRGGTLSSTGRLTQLANEGRDAVEENTKELVALLKALNKGKRD